MNQSCDKIKGERKANWIGHNLRRNCVLKHVIEGNIDGRVEVTGRRWKRSKQLLDSFSERRGYWKLKDKALHRKFALQDAMDPS